MVGLWEIVIFVCFFRLFNDHHFHNGVYEFTYSLMFMNNILICYKNIHQALEHVCVVLQYTLIVYITNLFMNRSWFMEKCNFVFLRMVWVRPCVIKFILLIPQVIIKIYIRAKTSLFCHVCNNISGLKIAKNVIRTIFVLEISSLNRQLSWILGLLLESRLYVTNLLTFTTHEIYIEI